jgi:hypothetical protein
METAMAGTDELDVDIYGKRAAAKNGMDDLAVNESLMAMVMARHLDSNRDSSVCPLLRTLLE